MIGGSLWIMYHMNMNMPPMAHTQPIAAAASRQTATGVIEARAPSLSRRRSAASSDRSTARWALGSGGVSFAQRSTRDFLERDVARGESGLRAAQARLKQDQAALAAAQTRPRRGPGASGRVEALRQALDRDERGVATAEQALDTAKARFADASVTAPMDGVVLSRNVEPGQAVAPNSKQPLFLFAPDATTIEFRASLPGALARRARTRGESGLDRRPVSGREFRGRNPSRHAHPRRGGPRGRRGGSQPAHGAETGHESDDQDTRQVKTECRGEEWFGRRPTGKESVMIRWVKLWTGDV